VGPTAEAISGQEERGSVRVQEKVRPSCVPESGSVLKRASIPKTAPRDGDEAAAMRPRVAAAIGGMKRWRVATPTLVTPLASVAVSLTW